jgi:hypothetical protein
MLSWMVCPVIPGEAAAWPTKLRKKLSHDSSTELGSASHARCSSSRYTLLVPSRKLSVRRESGTARGTGAANSLGRVEWKCRAGMPAKGLAGARDRFRRSAVRARPDAARNSPIRFQIKLPSPKSNSLGPAAEFRRPCSANLNAHPLPRTRSKAQPCRNVNLISARTLAAADHSVTGQPDQSPEKRWRHGNAAWLTNDLSPRRRRGVRTGVVRGEMDGDGQNGFAETPVEPNACLWARVGALYAFR